MITTQKRNDPLALAGKLFLQMLMALLFSFVLNMLFNSAIENNNQWGLIFLQIAELFIYGALVYRYMWKVGSSDLNKVKFNRERRDFFKGLKVGLIATAPNFAAFLLVIIGKIAGWSNGVLVVYKLFGICYVPVIYKYILTGNILAGVSLTRIILSGLCMLFVPVVATAAYMLGISGYSLTEHMLYNKKELNR